jgi:hypothetical protein
MEIDMEEYISHYNKMTEDLRCKIIEMWDKSISGGAIATELGITRNSVIGVIYRERAKGRIFRTHSEKRKPNNLQAKIIINDQPNKKTEPKGKNTKIILVKVIDDPITQEYFADDKSEICSMNDLQSYSCRYPVSEDNETPIMFCGKRQERGSYCKKHGAICYYPPKYQVTNLPD